MKWNKTSENDFLFKIIQLICPILLLSTEIIYLFKMLPSLAKLWHQIIYWNLKADTDNLLESRVVLITKVTILTLLIIPVYMLFLLNETTFLYINFTYFICFSLILVLRYLAFYQAYLIGFLVITNIATFITASYWGKEAGFYLYFFPLLLMNFFFFSFQEKLKLWLALAFTMSSLLILQITNYSLFKQPHTEVESLYINFVLNLFFSISLTLYWMYKLFEENYHINQKLKQEKSYFQAILDNSLLNIFLLDKSGIILTFNQKAKYETEKALEIPLEKGVNVSKYISESIQQAFQKRLAQAMRGEIQLAERLVELKNQNLWYEVSFTPIFNEDKNVDFVVFSTLDITQRKNAEMEVNTLLEETQRLNEELQANQEELRQNLEQTLSLNESLINSQIRLEEAQQIAKVGSYEINFLNNKVSFSEEYYRVFDVITDELRAKFTNGLQYAHPEDLKKVNDIINQAFHEQKDFELMHRVITSFGELKYVKSIGVFQFDEKNQAIGLRGTVQDITTEKIAEEAILTKNTELEKLNQELDNFVYSVSHDLRAPLASVLGLINLTKEEENASQILLYLELMQKSIRKLDVFIGNITDYSRNNRLEIQSEKIDFTLIIQDILESFKFLERAEQVKIDLDIEETECFYSDDARLRIILNNLISNAYKYQNPYQEHQFIKIKIQTNAQNVKILIQDNGIGIDESYIDKVFNMFVRATDKSTGSGLGLYIVKQSTEKLGGTIQMQSKLGEGTSFELEIPNQTNR